MDKIPGYIRESVAELKKVTWPTKKQIWASTLIVVIFTVISGAYLGAVDALLTAVFAKIL